MLRFYHFALVAAFACACGRTAQSFAGLVQVSGPTPFAAGCGGPAGPTGVNYPSAEVEPQLAVNPLDARNLIAVWQQDRWSNGGARGVSSAASFDSGHSWTRVNVPFTQCAGGTFERGSDPWATFAPDGTAYQIAYTFNQSTSDRAMQVARSSDGGRSWSLPLILEHDDDPDLAMDKETITADPRDASRVYAVWDRVTGFTNPTSPANRGPAFFTRTINGGVSWEAPVVISDPGADAQTVGNQIAVLPDGTLIDLLTIITQNSSQHPQSAVAVLRSTDQGASWSAPVHVAAAEFIGVVDAKTNQAVRSGTVVPSIGVDASSGTIYVAWEDARFSGGARDGIALSKSTDGGASWSPPLQVNQAGAAQAFTPVVSAAQGELAVSYLDLRNDDPLDRSRLLATDWLAVSSDGGASWHETQLSGPFNLQNAPFAGGYFVGDYQGLVHAGSAFLPLLVIARDDDASNRTDVFFRPAGAPGPSSSKPWRP